MLGLCCYLNKGLEAELRLCTASPEQQAVGEEAAMQHCFLAQPSCWPCFSCRPDQEGAGKAAAVLPSLPLQELMFRTGGSIISADKSTACKTVSGEGA